MVLLHPSIVCKLGMVVVVLYNGRVGHDGQPFRKGLFLSYDLGYNSKFIYLWLGNMKLN